MKRPSAALLRRNRDDADTSIGPISFANYS